MKKDLMQVFHEKLGALPYIGPCVFTIGNFDGVHKGHVSMLKAVSSKAKDLGVSSVVVTFSPHPVGVISVRNKPNLLMTLSQRIEAIFLTGIDLVWVIPFTLDLSILDSFTFLSKIYESLAPIELYIGCGFRFGNKRYGDLSVLETWGKKFRCNIYDYDLQHCCGDRVSSTRIRKALDFGDIGLARVLLGRDYIVTGIASPGKAVLFKNQCTSVNLLWEQEQLLRSGIYIAEVKILSIESSLWSITRIIQKSCFCQSSTFIEVFLPDLNKDIYGCRLQLRFLYCFENKQKLINFDKFNIENLQNIAKSIVLFSLK